MQTTLITLADGATYIFNSDGSCTNRWAGAANQTYYDRSDGTEKCVGDTLAMKDYINSISGVDKTQETQSYTRTLTPDMKADFDEVTDAEDDD